jgi:hypothetical protein
VARRGVDLHERTITLQDFGPEFVPVDTPARGGRLRAQRADRGNGDRKGKQPVVKVQLHSKAFHMDILLAQRVCEERIAGRDRHVLASVDRIGDGA